MLKKLWTDSYGIIISIRLYKMMALSNESFGVNGNMENNHTQAESSSTFIQ